MTNSHDDHDHDHSPQALRAEAIESLLLEKGLINAGDVDEVIALYSERVGPMNGAKVVARAWKDPVFKAELLADGTKAVDSFGFVGGQTEKLVVLENTEKVHNVVVCTLCSCYPWAVLGLPPKWYKDPAYRSRVVREPRTLLKEMGTEIADEVEIKVWDSSAEVRYMVLPMPPKSLSLESDEASLASQVTRDSMIGVERLV